MKYPKISIITASYNQGHFIEETITSVLDQGYPNLEYIIIDGGSTDSTIDIIKKYEKHLSYWVSENDKGQSDAINKGYRIATGDIINWLNSDDYYEPGCLAHIAQVFSNPSINAYTGTSRIFGEGVIPYYSKGTDVYRKNLFKTIGCARIDQPETFFRKAAIDDIGYLNESLHYVMDKDLWIRYLSKFGLHSVAKDEQLLVHFRLHNQSKTVSLKEKFSKETASLFYTYALEAGYTKYSAVFNSLFEVSKLPLVRVPELESANLWEQAFNYFLLQRGLEAYALDYYNAAKSILNAVRAELLHEEDQRNLNSVLKRIKYLPVEVKRFWNKIRS